MVNKTLKFWRKKKQFKDCDKVLLSGNFMTFMRVHMKNVHHFNKIFGRKAKLYATRCSIKEAGYANHLCEQALKNLKINHIECTHKGKSEELQCLLSKVGGGNTEGYYVSTKEDDWINRLQQLEAVPILSCSGNEIILQKQSEMQEQFN